MVCAVAACVPLLACGAKTGLLVPRRDAQAPIDAADVVDVVDAGTMMRTYLGTEFWPVSTSNSNLPREYRFDFAVAVGNPNPDTVTVTITGGALTAPIVATVASHRTSTFTLPWVDAIAQRTTTDLPCQGEPVAHETQSVQVANGAYRVQASAPVDAYQFNPLQFQAGGAGCVNHTYTNDASLLLPTAALGNDYLLLTYDGVTGSFVTITGTQDTPTTVTLMPEADIVGGSSVISSGAHVMRQFTLRRGEVVQLTSDGDLSGSELHASAPVAVFVGVDCTNVSPAGDGECCCDHLEEQLFPSDTWGQEVVVSQLQDRTPTEGNMVRIISREDGNQLTFSPPEVHAPATLARGEVLMFESTTDFVVHGTQPMLVAQFMEGQQTTADATVGDPAMVFEVPALQYRTEYSFVVPATYTANYIYVTAHADATVLLDGNPLGAVRTPIPGSTWTVLRPRIQPGSHTLSTTDPAGFGLKVVGVAPYTSYMYPGGLDLARH